MPKLSLIVTTPAGSTQVFKDADVQSQQEASFRVGVVLAVSGVYSFVVTNTDGGVSQPFRLELREAGPAAAPATALSAPVISAITPSKTSKQSQPQAFHLDGSRFMQGLTVTISDPVGGATVVSGNGITDLTANGLTFTSAITVEGEYTISVTNPDGKTSNAVSLSVRGIRSPVL